MEEIDIRGKLPKPKLTTKDVKSLVVLFDRKVLKVAELAIPAPVGVGIDKTTGGLDHPVRLELVDDVVLKPTVLKGLLINHGSVKVRLTIENHDPDPCPTKKEIVKHLLLPVQSILKIKGIRPGDHVQEFPKVESLLVFGFPDHTGPGVGMKIKLVVKVILRVRLIVAREEILTIPVVEKPCPKKKGSKIELFY